MLFYLRSAHARLLVRQIFWAATVPSAQKRSAKRVSLLSNLSGSGLHAESIQPSNVSQPLSFSSTYHVSAVRESWFRNWPTLLSKHRTLDLPQNPHDLSSISATIDDIKKEVKTVVSEPVSEVIRKHNDAISKTNRALEATKMEWFGRRVPLPQIEKKELVLKEMTAIRDFYVAFVASETFQKMKTVQFSKKMKESCLLVDKKIVILEGIHADVEQKIKQLSGDAVTMATKDEIKLKSLQAQRQMRAVAIQALKNYQSALNKHPAQLLSIEKIVENLVCTLEQHVHVLNATCDTLSLLIHIDKSLALAQLNDIADSIQKSWSELENIVDIFTKSTEQEIAQVQWDLDTKAAENAADRAKYMPSK